MKELLYNNLLTYYSGIEAVKVKGWTNYENFTALNFTIDNFFSDTNLTSNQNITIGGRSSNVKTITSNNGAFEWSLITITSNPISIPTYTTTFDTTLNRIVKSQGTTPTNFSYTTFLRYTINWSKLAQNIIFFNKSDNISKLKGDYLFCDTINLNDNVYYISNFFISCNNSNRSNASFSNVYSLFPNGKGINEDRFSYCDSQFIGTERYDLTSIVNPNNEVNKENVENDINNIISRNAVYNYSYLDDAPRNKITNILDAIKENSLRNFYTFGNNYSYLSGVYKDFYEIETTGSDQPHWHSTFKNWNRWTIGADRTLPLRNIGIGIGLDEKNYNSFYEAWEYIGHPNGYTTSEAIEKGTSPLPEKIEAISVWTKPNEYEGRPNISSYNVDFQVPFNYMLDMDGNSTTTIHLGHEIITSNYCFYSPTSFASSTPRIIINKVDNTKINVNAFDPNAYQQLETVLNNIPYINLIGGSTTLLVLGILSLALILKVGHILK